MDPAIPELEPEQETIDSKLIFIITFIIIIVLTPIYALLAYSSYRDPKTLAYWITTFLLMISGMLLVSKGLSLMGENPVQARHWGWISSIVWTVTFIVLPIALLEWWKGSIRDIVLFWVIRVLYVIGIVFVHAPLELNYQKSVKMVAVHPIPSDIV